MCAWGIDFASIFIMFPLDFRWVFGRSVGIIDRRNDIKQRLFILLVHVIKYTSSKNVDIKLSAHEAFLE
jgi:hypothetical protein